MARVLDTFTLNNYSKDFAAWWIQDRPPLTRDFLKKEFYKFTFKDEFQFLIGAVAKRLSGEDRDAFEQAIADLIKKEPRSDKVFEELLLKKLAIDKDGNKVEGAVGTTQIGQYVDGTEVVTLRDGRSKVIPKKVPIYAGQEHLLKEKVENGTIDVPKHRG